MGIPAVQICTIIPIAQTAGSNRIARAVAIPHPVGAPGRPKEEALAIREEIVRDALSALTTETDSQLVVGSKAIG